jgi:hypothetical protein
LGEVELHGGLSTENVDEHLDLKLILVDLGDVAREGGEGPGLDLDGVVDRELVLSASVASPPAGRPLDDAGE